MSKNIEEQLVDKLRTRNFSLRVDESTIKGGEVVLMTYDRYIYCDDFVEEMLLCEFLDSTATAVIFKKIKDYFNINKIPMKNIISCDADGLLIYDGHAQKLFKKCKMKIIQIS